MEIVLKTSKATAVVETTGGELISYRDMSGKEYLWQKDPTYWAKCSPLLFPIVGNLRNNQTIIGDRIYTMPKHGFGKFLPFRVVSQTENTLELEATDSEETQVTYPYAFILSMTYSLIDDQLSLTYTVKNPGTTGMDYCIGGHPAFNVPMGEDSFSDYYLEFNQKEDGGCIVYDLEKLEFSVDRRVDLTDGSNRVALHYDLFDEDALVFDTIRSDSVKLQSAKTGLGVQFDFHGFSSIAFWTPIKLQAPFLCLEPWNGMGVRSDEDDVFAHKYGACHLKPGESKQCGWAFRPIGE